MFCQYTRRCFCFWWRFCSIFPSRFLTLEKHQTLSQWRSLTIWSPYLLWIATVTHRIYEKNIENILKYWENSIKWILYTNSFLLSISASVYQRCFLLLLFWVSAKICFMITLFCLRMLCGKSPHYCLWKCTIHERASVHIS